MQKTYSNTDSAKIKVPISNCILGRPLSEIDINPDEKIAFFHRAARYLPLKARRQQKQTKYCLKHNFGI
jgi:hypothetical protein